MEYDNIMSQRYSWLEIRTSLNYRTLPNKSMPVAMSDCNKQAEQHHPLESLSEQASQISSMKESKTDANEKENRQINSLFIHRE